MSAKAGLFICSGIIYVFKRVISTYISMKYKLLLLTAALVAMLVLDGCNSGKKAFERGNYYEAVLKSVSRLRKNPDHRKSKETLRKSYPLALQTLEKKVKN